MVNPSGHRFPRQTEDELIAWLKDMFRNHGGRFMTAAGAGADLMRKFLIGHRVYKALQSDPQAWAKAVKDLVHEFGQEAVERFFEKLNKK